MKRAGVCEKVWPEKGRERVREEARHRENGNIQRERDREKIEEVQIDRERCIERKEGIQRQVKKHR